MHARQADDSAWLATSKPQMKLEYTLQNSVGICSNLCPFHSLTPAPETIDDALNGTAPAQRLEGKTPSIDNNPPERQICG
jgi:hypothetical protein